MKKKIKVLLFIILLVVIIVTIRLFIVVFQISYYGEKLKEQNHKEDVIEEIDQKVKLLADPSCLQITYAQSDQFNCLQAKRQECDLKNISIQSLKEMNQTLEKAIEECVNLQIKKQSSP